MTDRESGARAWLDWYADMGVTDLVADRPTTWYLPERFERPAPAAPLRDPAPPAAPTLPAIEAAAAPRKKGGAEDGAVVDARKLAQSCRSLDELVAALRDFDGCRLKDTALNLCVYDGNPKARIMLIGEAPGGEEDRLAKPFVGPSGQLLDRMLAHIGLDRTQVYITNLVFWRPPGNRQPTAGELAICQPFLEREIELLQPALIQFVGGMAAKALLDVKEGITRLRGRRFTYASAELGPIPALVMFHPAYLLRQPANKRFSWRDILMLRQVARELGLMSEGKPAAS